MLPSSLLPALLQLLPARELSDRAALPALGAAPGTAGCCCSCCRCLDQAAKVAGVRPSEERAVCHAWLAPAGSISASPAGGGRQLACKGGRLGRFGEICLRRERG